MQLQWLLLDVWGSLSARLSVKEANTTQTETPPPPGQRPQEGTWGQAARHELTSYRMYKMFA